MFVVVIAEDADLAAAAQVVHLLSQNGVASTLMTSTSLSRPDIGLAMAAVVICSPRSLQSSWVREQAQRAEAAGKPLLLVARREVDPAQLGDRPFAWIDDRKDVVDLVAGAIRAGGAEGGRGGGVSAASAVPRSTGADIEAALWSAAKEANDVSAIVRYLQEFPDGSFAGAARAAIADLERKTLAAPVAAPAAAPAPVVAAAPAPEVASPPADPAPTPAPAPLPSAPVAASAQAAPKATIVAAASPPPPSTQNAPTAAVAPAPVAVPRPREALPDQRLTPAALAQLRGPVVRHGEVSGELRDLFAPGAQASAPAAPVLAPQNVARRKSGAPPPVKGDPKKSRGLGLIAGLAVLVAAGGAAWAFRGQLGDVAQGLAKNAEKLLAVLGLSKGALPPLPAAASPLQAQTDLVDCSVFAPPAVAKGQPFLVQAFLHLVEQEERVAFLAATMDEGAKLRGRQTLQVPIARGTRVRIEIDGRGVDVAEPVQEIVWHGEPNVAAFSCTMPAGTVVDVVHPVARLYVDDFPVGRVLFQIKAEAGQRSVAPSVPEMVGHGARRYTRAFLSYASHDRAEVLKRAQALEVAKIGYFMDNRSLTPGEEYEKRIFQVIREADLFMLFWSRHARASRWVGAEIDYARECQQVNPLKLPDIVPVMLDDPRDAPPPERLGDRHFNDTIAALISYEERRPKGTGGFLSRWFGRG